LNTYAESAPGVLVNQSGRTDQSVAPVKKKAVGAAPKAARAAKSVQDSIRHLLARPLEFVAGGKRVQGAVSERANKSGLSGAFRNRGSRFRRLPRKASAHDSVTDTGTSIAPLDRRDAPGDSQGGDEFGAFTSVIRESLPRHLVRRARCTVLRRQPPALLFATEKSPWLVYMQVPGY
jgi:hypothetical protein